MLYVKHFILDLVYLSDAEDESVFKDLQILKKEFDLFIQNFDPEKDFSFDLKIFRGYASSELVFFIVTSILSNQKIKNFKMTSGIVDDLPFESNEGYFVDISAKKVKGLTILVCEEQTYLRFIPDESQR